MIPLPIDSVIPEIVQRARPSRAVVVVAPPGAGKTTRVPPAILREKLLTAENPNLVLLQPRRVAARAVAGRMAEENNWSLGQEVGYHIRFERRLTDQTRLRVMTEGILTRQIVEDPFLPGVGCVILDEFHERSIHTDLAIAMLREIQQNARPDLILIVMSATLAAGPVSRFLGDAPIVHSEGRMFEVKIEHRPATHKELADAVAREVATLQRDGDVLVFLPGVEEIRRTARALETAPARDLLVLPLHGSLPGEDQIAALRPAPPGKRKIILATNIAETSLTIEGVRIVIDSGLARVAGYDPRRGMDRLELARISKASVTQRAGRAGRTAPGHCIRLYSAATERALDDFELPEIQRVDLCSTVLAVHEFGHAEPRTFGWYEPPDEHRLAAAESLLAMLGALNAERGGKITRIGEQLLTLPVHPRIGRLLIEAAANNLIEDGATIAALLSEKDILRPQNVPHHERTATHRADSDLTVRMELLHRAENARFAAYFRDEGLDIAAARQAGRVRDELQRLTKRLSKRLPEAYHPERSEGSGGRVASEIPRSARNDMRGEQEGELLRLPLYAYPDRVCRRRAPGSSTAIMVGGSGVKLSAESAVHDHEFFLALDARTDERDLSRQALVRIASAIHVQWLEQSFPSQIRRQRILTYDEQRDRVVARGVTCYRDLVLREDADVAVNIDRAGEIIAQALAPSARSIFEADESCIALFNRVALLRHHMPEHPWPLFDDNQLAAIFTEAAQGKRSLAEIKSDGLINHLRTRLAYPLDRLLDQHAPESIEVPSGSRIRLSYQSNEQPPILAARLQELFGWTETPRLAAGRVPLLIHLLGPNYRPVQITSDLANFWRTTYFQVRKDLRVRYPKHSWPEDPLTAKPEAKGTRRRA